MEEDRIDIAQGCWSSSVHLTILRFCSACSIVIIALLLIMGQVLGNQKFVDFLIIAIITIGWGTLVFWNERCTVRNHNKYMRNLITGKF